MKEEKKSCKLCETEREGGVHVMKECNYSGTDEGIVDLVSEEGQGIEWMKIVKKNWMERIKEEKKEESVR